MIKGSARGETEKVWKVFWSRHAAVDFTGFVQGFEYHQHSSVIVIPVYHSNSCSQKKSIAIFPVQLGYVLSLSETSGSFSLAVQERIRL